MRLTPPWACIDAEITVLCYGLDANLHLKFLSKQ